MKKTIIHFRLILIAAIILLQSIANHSYSQWATVPVQENETPTITYVLIGLSSVAVITAMIILIVKKNKKSDHKSTAFIRPLNICSSNLNYQLPQFSSAQTSLLKSKINIQSIDFSIFFPLPKVDFQHSNNTLAIEKGILGMKQN